MSVAIIFEGVSKRYRLGEVGTGTLSNDLHRAWVKLRGRPDPFTKVGGRVDRDSRIESSPPDSSERVSGLSRLFTGNATEDDYVWALKDVSFNVQQGEVLGIIGRNGAGKSTLLKLLSRITAPTTGKIKARGRITSLLEVGTGFHPELTGRENIYLNGAILGMRRYEITKQIDAIIDFSGCEKYIDTPVKRYSSGMTVRLGFAVAAYLNCEILVVDEVLAVGDADFQTKCLGKMKDISSGEGKTVLFVSHNLRSVSELCSRSVWIDYGTVVDSGRSEMIVSNYLSKEKEITVSDGVWNSEQEISGFSVFRFNRVAVSQRPNSDPVAIVRSESDFEVGMWFTVTEEIHGAVILMRITDSAGTVVLTSWESDCRKDRVRLTKGPGSYQVQCTIPGYLLKPGRYIVSIGAHIPGKEALAPPRPLLMIDVVDGTTKFNVEREGLIRPILEWSQPSTSDINMSMSTGSKNE